MADEQSTPEITTEALSPTARVANPQVQDKRITP